MIPITNLTRGEKRVILVSETSQRYGTTRFREASGRIVPTFLLNPREPNPIDPGTVVQDSCANRYVDGRGLGARRYDATIDAWVRLPRPPLPAPVRPRPSVDVSSDTSGDWYWIVDRSTGVNMRRIRARTAAAAQSIAAQYALSNRLPACAAYARLCHD